MNRLSDCSRNCDEAQGSLSFLAAMPPSPPTMTRTPAGPNRAPRAQYAGTQLPAAATPSATSTVATEAAAVPPLTPMASDDGFHDRVQTRVRELAYERFAQSHPGHVRYPATAPAPSTGEACSWARPWIKAGASSTTGVIDVSVQVQVDRKLGKYETFSVLGWDGAGAVLGAVGAGDLQFRKVPSSRLPRSTLIALQDLESAAIQSLASTYTDSSFVDGVTYTRPATSGVAARTKRGVLVRDGPFEAMVCNEEMQAILTSMVSWTRQRNGKQFRTCCVLRAQDPRGLPHDTREAARTGSAKELDFRGDACPLEMRAIVSFMRDPNTRLPYWRSATAFSSKTRLLHALQDWLTSPAAAVVVATSEANGLALTMRALGVKEGERSYHTRTRNRPDFILCNGQTGNVTTAAVTWEKAVRCLCHIEKPPISNVFSETQLRKKCGEDGRSSAQRKRRKGGAA